MPLLCFSCFRFSGSRDDSSFILHFDADDGPPRILADNPPPLSSTATNLFDPFPRVVFGGYGRYYAGNDRRATCRFESSRSSITEDPWSWQTLPKFTGKKPRCKKPRIRASAMPLVDATYPWPEWVARFAATQIFTAPELENGDVSSKKPRPLHANSDHDFHPEDGESSR
ncbi:hypothetical protein B0H17DRAFT_1193535 [Mycena rosella]|uniref:Uncharacterized protein n=1 Tax=Mycena rosella TaxID=1033263 RepID=A0AAD7GSK6_MYCRO|nr:hypothetical protein B0H17DRAFT_1193535 [Mycena rosella]